MEQQIDFEVSREPISKWKNSSFWKTEWTLLLDKTIALKSISPDIAILKPSGSRKYLYGCGIIGLLSIALSIYLLLIREWDYEKHPFWIFDHIFFVMIGCTGILFLIMGVKTSKAISLREVILDRNQKIVSFKMPYKNLGTQFHFANIAALQILLAEPGNSIYEVNLVLKKPQGERLLLIFSNDEKAIQQDVEWIANFIKIPILDYTRKTEIILGKKVEIERFLLSQTTSKRMKKVSYNKYIMNRGEQGEIILQLSLAKGCLCFLFRNAKIVFDPHTRTVTGKRLMLKGKRIGEVRFKDILALQLCSGILFNDEIPSIAYQYNLILSSPQNARIHLNTLREENQVRKEASELAKLLKVPILDHTRTTI